METLRIEHLPQPSARRWVWRAVILAAGTVRFLAGGDVLQSLGS